MQDFEPVTVDEFKDFITQQINEGFYLGFDCRNFTFGFIENLNKLFESLQK
jgi:hypothetical protein